MPDLWLLSFALRCADHYSGAYSAKKEEEEEDRCRRVRYTGWFDAGGRWDPNAYVMSGLASAIHLETVGSHARMQIRTISIDPRSMTYHSA